MKKERDGGREEAKKKESIRGAALQGLKRTYLFLSLCLLPEMAAISRGPFRF